MACWAPKVYVNDSLRFQLYVVALILGVVTNGKTARLIAEHVRGILLEVAFPLADEACAVAAAEDIDCANKMDGIPTTQPARHCDFAIGDATLLFHGR